MLLGLGEQCTTALNFTKLRANKNVVPGNKSVSRIFALISNDYRDIVNAYGLPLFYNITETRGSDKKCSAPSLSYTFKFQISNSKFATTTSLAVVFYLQWTQLFESE